MSNVPVKKSRLQTVFKRLRKWALWIGLLLLAYWAWKSYGNMLTGDGVIEGNIARPTTKLVTSKIVTECEIKARVAKEYSYPEIAKIEKFNFQVGSPVKKGDLLVTLSSDAITQKYAAAQKDLSEAKGTLASMREDVRSSKLLYQKDLESQSSFIDKKKSMEKYENEKYRQTIAAFEQAANDREKLRIYSVFDGFITEQSKFDGDLVVKDEPILTVSKIEDLYSRFYISKIYRNNIREGMYVTYYNSSDAGMGTPIATGKITLVSNFIAKKGIMVEMSFVPEANSEDVSKYLNQNLVSVIKVAESSGPVLSIPLGAVFSDDKGYFIYSLDSGKTERLPVQLGLIGYEDAELKTALPTSQKVLVDPKTYPSGGMAFKKRAN